MNVLNVELGLIRVRVRHCMPVRRVLRGRINRRPAEPIVTSVPVDRNIYNLSLSLSLSLSLYV